MSASESNYHTVSTFDRVDDGTSKMEQGNKYRQFLVGVIVNLSSAALGTTLGWTAPVFPKLEKVDDDNPLGRVPTPDEKSWIGAIIAIGALVAPFAAGPLTNIVGRKLTLLGSTVFFVLAWILLITADTVIQMYIARLIQGFGVGFVMTAQTMYIGEIASDECRGALGSFMQLFIVSGILYVYAIGPYVGYIALQWICLILPLLFAATFFFMPESPHYYISKGKKADALNSLKFLRGKSAEGVQDELNEIQASVEEAMRNPGTIVDIIKSAGNTKALIICSGLLVFQQLSGINVILFYSTNIFKSTGSDIDPAISTIIIGIVQVLASGVTPIIADRLGRKPILLASAAGMGLSLTTLGLYFYLKSINSEVVDSISVLPIVSMILFVTVYCVGFGPLPWAVLGEMFPANVKSVASSIVASICWVLGFIITKWFQSVDDALGTHWAFWIFAICCAVGFAFTLTLVMETKGLSLQQIQDRLNGLQ